MITPKQIFKAIYKATGLTEDVITSRSRKIDVVYARMIIVYYMNIAIEEMNITDKHECIGRIIKRDHSMVHHIISQLDHELAHNKVFIGRFNRVTEYLKKTNNLSEINA